MRNRVKALLLAAVASVAGCSGYLTARYDPAVESGATQLQEKVDGFLTGLQETAGTPEGEYDRHVADYQELRGDIQALREAAAKQPGNDLTVRSLDLIAGNVGKLEAMHSDGLTAEEIDVVRTLLDTQFRMLVRLESAKQRKEG